MTTARGMAGAAADTNEAASAAAKVTEEPMNAYQVHAVAAVHQTHASTATPLAMPTIIAREPTPVVRTPTRKAPSTGPAASDSTARPVSSTDLIHCAPSATPICATPQKIVAAFDTRISVA